LEWNTGVNRRVFPTLSFDDGAYLRRENTEICLFHLGLAGRWRRDDRCHRREGEPLFPGIRVGRGGEEEEGRVY